MERRSLDICLQHKQKPAQFQSIADGIQKRLEKTLSCRKSSRLSFLDSLRNISHNASPVSVTVAQQKRACRLQKLERWKEERNKKKKEAAAKKKKPFLAGVPHICHKYALIPPPPVKANSSGRNNKSAPALSLYSSCSFAPKNATFKPPKFKNILNLPTLAPPKQTKSKIKKKLVEFEGKISSSSDTDSSNSLLKTFQSSASSDTEPWMITTLPTFKIQSSSTASESSSQSSSLLSDTTLEQKAPKNHMDTRISPCVTITQGKNKATREMEKKLREGLRNERTSVDKIDRYHWLPASQIHRMKDLCYMWESIMETTALPDSIQESILGAMGQCRLLTSQKLKQFEGLVEQCAHPEPGAKLVTLTDLHGFWDLILIQINDVDMRFKKLQDLERRNWMEEPMEEVAVAKKARKKVAKPVAAVSRIKEIIAAARKAKKDQLLESSLAAEKTFEVEFFSVTSPVRCPAPPPPTPSTNSTLPPNKQHTISFNTLRASVLGMYLEFDGISQFPETPSADYVTATPGPSILKEQPELNLKEQSVVKEGDLHGDNKKPIKRTCKLIRQDAIDIPIFTLSPSDAKRKREQNPAGEK